MKGSERETEEYAEVGGMMGRRHVGVGCIISMGSQ